ncbi:MAG TPA: type II toxin-antitoxin system RelE/ParE family toxin [Planctomicrobium sp.]|nr:type II toxin-antitoxin system RelE/ParE family toxin [Planctomicrobium sp.]
MSYRVLITGPAKRDLRAIVAWWSEHRSTEQAQRWYSRIYPAIAALSEQPDRCPLAPETDLLPSGLRQLHFGLSRRTTHRILFTIVGGEVRVLRVRHTAQNDLSADGLTES